MPRKKADDGDSAVVEVTATMPRAGQKIWTSKGPICNGQRVTVSAAEADVLVASGRCEVYSPAEPENGEARE